MKYILPDAEYSLELPSSIDEFGGNMVITMARDRILGLIGIAGKATPDFIYYKLQVYTKVFIDFMLRQLERDGQIEFKGKHWQLKKER